MNTLIEQLREIFSPILESEKVELIELKVKGKVGNHIIKVFVDMPGGITLDKCISLSRQFLDRLDVEDIIPGKYRLEVSSPGVDRPLKNLADFNRNLGKEVKLIYQDKFEEHNFEGKIINVLDERIQIQGRVETKIIPVSKIKIAKIKLPW